LIVALLVGAGIHPGPALGAAYKIANLGTLGGAFSSASGLNDAGTVVGDSAPVGLKPEEAFRYQEGTMMGLGTLAGGVCSRANDINGSGTIVGNTYCRAHFPNLAPFKAFTYRNGVMQEIGTLGGPGSSAYAINQSGWIAGSADTDSGVFHAFLLREGMMTDLGTLGGDSSAAYDLNDGGIVVGSSANASGANRAFRYDGTMVDLGTLGGKSSDAYAINAGGLIVGSANTSDGATHAFRYDGTMHDLGTLGGKLSFANDVNANGIIVGSSTRVAGGEYHAFVYDGSMRDLNDLIPPNSGWLLNHAVAINAQGQIAGNGLFKGVLQAFLLTPAPVVTYSVKPDGTIEITSTDNLSEAIALSGPYVDLGVKTVTINPATENGNRFFQSAGSAE
jgi:probable HAF family extracellular repeat protein